MSLQVWLPLNGSNKQQGLSSIVMSGSPNSWTNGKIGKCATFAGSVSNVIYNNGTSCNYTDNFSWCLWVKTNYTGSTAQYVFTNGRADYGGYGYGLQCASASSCTIRYGNSSWSVPVTGRVWTHIAFTKKGSTIKIYKNGSLYSTNTFSGTTPTYSDGKGLGIGCFHYTGDIYPFYGSVNDFRIYDHCLSPKEVKEISKGLCLHYPLNDSSIEDTTNLLPANTYNHVSMGGYWNGTVAATTFDGCKCFSITNSTINSYGDGFISGAATLTAGNTYTYSGYIYVPAGRNFRVGMRLSSGGNAENISITGNNQWQYFSHTFTATSNMTGAIEGSETTNYIDSTVYYVRNLQIEQKDHATPFAAGTRSNSVVYDCSGFGYNGTKSGTIIINNDSPRHNSSYRFNKSYITAPISNTLKPSDAITLSCWVKLDSQVSSGELCLFSCFEGGGAGLDIYNGKYGMQIYSGGYKAAWVTVNDMTVWHHFAGTFDGQNIKTYLDGELVSTTSVTSSSIITYNSTTPWELGGNPGPSGGASDSKMIGNVSDARIYATALSAEDIKELYNVGMSIDNQGNLFCGEVVE